MERRQSIRFRLRCEVRCTWYDGLGSANAITGVTHDISAAGLFIVAQDCPWSGASATVDIQLPGRTSFTQELQLHGRGRVVRIIQNGVKSGFAIMTVPGWTIGRNRNRAVASAV